MSIILSNGTARLFHRLHNRPSVRAALPSESAELKPGPVDTALADRARRLLVAYGAPPAEVSQLDVLVRRDCDRRVGSGVNAHVWKFPLPQNSLIRLDRGVYVTDVLLTAQLSAREFDERELAEYLMELCGAYSLPPDQNGLITRPPLVTPDEVAAWADLASGQHGANKLRRALVWAQPGARSPMETAFFMLLRMPRRLGGLHLSELKLAHRIDVVGEARKFTRRTYLECDLFLLSSLTDFEYNGIIHEEEEQFVIDAERLNALEVMGYNVIIVTRRALFDQEAFCRLMCAIEHRTGKRADRAPLGFAEKQEELRQFVLRRYLGSPDLRM